jgi:hypothetical protein
MRSWTGPRTPGSSRQPGGTKRQYSGLAGICPGRLQQAYARVDAVVRRLIQVEDVEDVRLVVAGPDPPGGAGHQTVAAQGHPHPLGASPAFGQIAGQLVVEGAVEAVEQVELFGPGDRAQGQVVRILGQGTLR